MYMPRAVDGFLSPPSVNADPTFLNRSLQVNVSSNIAPSTATASVTSNRLFALAYQGFHFFKPLEVFQQETSNAVMAAMLIHDIRNPKVLHLCL